MSCTTAIPHLTWFFHCMISRHNMIFHSMILSACTSSLYKTLYNTWFYHAMETFYICIKTCITWFWANKIFFSCHKNNVGEGLLYYYCVFMAHLESSFWKLSCRLGGWLSLIHYDVIYISSIYYVLWNLQ